MAFQEALLKSLTSNGNRIAMEEGDRKLTFRDVLSRSNRITHFLRHAKATPGTLVGILLNDRVNLICSMIGVMNAGCVAVPLNPELPAKRMMHMINDLDLRCMILSSETANVCGEGEGMSRYRIEDIVAETDNVPLLSTGYPEFSEEDAIYIYFTSGSTGRPKGIVGKNGSLLQYLRWEIDEFNLDHNCRVSQFISPYFDAFLRDVFVPLLAGGTICLPPRDADFFTPSKVVSWIDRAQITLIHCVPSVFNVICSGDLSPDHFKTLRHVLLSGERIVPSQLERWYKVYGGRIGLVNLYGATETTMIRSCYRIRPEDADKTSIPVGPPIRDTRLLIAGKDLQPCKMYVPGDLYIISRYVSHGYLNSPELTHEKFFTIDQGTSSESIAFRTGDKARMIEAGNIDLIGREDRQVKIRGIRIELEEIERVLLQSRLVNNAIVMKCGDGQESLAAFVIGTTVGNADLENKLLVYLKGYLPEYMLPSNIIVMTAFPLLSNGKIDQRGLLSTLTRRQVTAPENETEKALLAVWKEILGDKEISTTDNFHQIGGNSLSIMRLIAKIYKVYNVRVALSELFNNLTIRKQAELIRRSSHDHSLAIVKAPEKPAYRLSSSQERIYFNALMDPASTAFNLPMVWEIKGEVSANHIGETFRALIQRHESLRTQFVFSNDQVHQVVSANVDLKIREITTTEESIDTTIAGLVKPFDLERAPLLRAAILSAGSRKFLFTDIHHIVCDGLSQMILFTDFLRLFQGEVLKPLALQYKDYAEWEHAHLKTNHEYITGREFWLKAFDGALPKLTLPVAVADEGEDADNGAMASFVIHEATLKRLAETLKARGITPFSGLFAIYLIYLYQLTGQEDLVIGINTAGRLQDELEGVVGMFAKTLPIRYRVNAGLRFTTFAEGVHQYLVEANSKQFYDLTDIVSELNKNRPVPVKDLFETMFSFQDHGYVQRQTSSEHFSSYALERIAAKYPLHLFATEVDGAFHFRIEYMTSYFTKADMELLIAQFQSLVKDIAEKPDDRIMDYVDHGVEAQPQVSKDIAFNF
ncbi:amino acid adenylation domain-containing protein [Fulvivirgaceae bacterium PWU4]|uniref:Amino acid adenylation domain-containing protein n=1 Tax=Chryseosolibacter histidini TaxID=2782349 RepID=A0AAP2GGY6_9BACT|nr:amino acid adenylation domain-containing protein [Chryseosolibacter histidini]MBT1695436.1 amino acid adenylation domain-containing protein [Chryseosolibacter histidini]